MDKKFLIIFFICVVVGFLILGYKITNNEKTKLYKVKDEEIKPMYVTIDNKK